MSPKTYCPIVFILLCVAFDTPNLAAQQPSTASITASAATNAAQTNAQDFDEATKAKAEEYNQLVENALKLYSEGKFGEAIEPGKKFLLIAIELYGEDSPTVATAWSWLAAVAEDDEQWNLALEQRKKTLALLTGQYGERHWKVTDAKLAIKNTEKRQTLNQEQLAELRQADSMNLLAKKEFQAGNYSAAIANATQLLAIQKKILGVQNPQYARSLDNLILLYESKGDYARAELLYKQTLENKKVVLGEQHPQYLLSLNNLALLYKTLGEYARAEPLSRRAMEITKVLMGEQHPIYATSLNDLAVLYVRMGDHARALPLYQQASEISKMALGEQHPHYASTLHNLAELHYGMGDYAGAEELNQQALAIWKNTLGEQHPAFAGSLNNMAAVYTNMGDYARAEPLYRQALKIRKVVLGEQHPDYAQSLNNLAMLYISIGDLERAMPLYQQALDIGKVALGEQHPDYALVLNNLAGLYEKTGDYERAESLFREALEICKVVLGDQHPDYAGSLNNLASLYYRQGDYARAEELYQQGLEVIRAALGEQHPDYALGLNNLAALYDSVGDYARAEQLYLQASEVWQIVLGDRHPNYATNLNSLAGLYAKTKRFDKAIPLFEQGLATTRKSLDDTAYVLSERQQLAMNQSLRFQLDNYLTACLLSPDVPLKAVENVLQWKGSVLYRLRGLRMAADDPNIADQFKKLQQAAARLSKLAQAVPEPKQAINWRARVAKLTAEKEALESELMQSSAVFREAVQQVTFGQIQQAIPADGVLVDYLEFNGKTGRELLVSIVKHEGQPTMIGLGSATEVGTAIDVWRETFGMSPQAKAAGLKLRKQIWEPVLEHLGDAKTILVSTDGALGRLPLAALPGKEPGSYLIEDHRLALIPVPQLLPALVNEQGRKQLQHELLLMGDVDYDSATAENESSTNKPPLRKRPWERSQLAATVRGDSQWAALSETKAEVEFIAGLYKRLYDPGPEAVLDLRQSAASESAFRNLAPNTMFLHLATHGFFAAPEKQSALSPELIAQHGQDRAGQLGQEREAIRGFSPGQLSGIVFAGANQPPAPIDPLNQAELPDDGIMTADEIAFLRLDGVRLVVLSACETGLGEVAGGEALLGIQRGFQLAGADSTVASLWKVNDAATRRLMQEFYTNYLEREMSMLDALRETQLWALNHPTDIPRGVVRDNSADESTRLPPRYWAPFVLSGSWK